MVSFTFNFLMGFLPALLNSSALFPMSKGCTTSNRFKKSFQSFHSRVVSNLKVIVYESPAPKKVKNENSRFIRKSFCSLSPKSTVFSRLLFHVIELARSFSAVWRDTWCGSFQPWAWYVIEIMSWSNNNTKCIFCKKDTFSGI